MGARLLAFACGEGLPILAAWLLPVAGAASRSVAAMAAAVEATVGDGLSLIHRAVQSGNPTVLKVLLEWGREHGHAWQAETPGPGGITPLHLAALLPPDSPIPQMLVQHCNPGALSPRGAQLACGACCTAACLPKTSVASVSAHR